MGIILDYFIKLFILEEKMQIFVYSSSEILHLKLEMDSVAYSCNVEQFVLYMKFISVSLNSY